MVLHSEGVVALPLEGLGCPAEEADFHRLAEGHTDLQLGTAAEGHIEVAGCRALAQGQVQEHMGYCIGDRAHKQVGVHQVVAHMVVHSSFATELQAHGEYVRSQIFCACGIISQEVLEQQSMIHHKAFFKLKGYLLEARRALLGA